MRGLTALLSPAVPRCGARSSSPTAYAAPQQQPPLPSVAGPQLPSLSECAAVGERSCFAERRKPRAGAGRPGSGWAPRRVYPTGRWRRCSRGAAGAGARRRAPLPTCAVSLNQGEGSPGDVCAGALGKTRGTRRARGALHLFSFLMGACLQGRRPAGGMLFPTPKPATGPHGAS